MASGRGEAEVVVDDAHDRHGPARTPGSPAHAGHRSPTAAGGSGAAPAHGLSGDGHGGHGSGHGAGHPPSISLPKGGGAIRGIGEKFNTNPVTGTASLAIPLATSPGRSGFGPQLSLEYDSGAG